MVLEWLRHQLSDAASEGLARSVLFFGELEAKQDGATAKRSHRRQCIRPLAGFLLGRAKRDPGNVCEVTKKE